jgi:uncharacterized protein YjiS (DUF1127 family)
MTTMDLDELALGDANARAPNFWTRAAAFFARHKERKLQRLTVYELSRLDPHLLRDIGIDMADIEAATLGRHRSVWLNPISRR